MNTKFSDLPLLEQTKQALEILGFDETTDIQALAIPKMIEGIDFIAQAQTGTGKTFAFVIPMIEKINTRDRHIQSLILCPNRELSMQVYKEILKLVKFYQELRVSVIVGGESYDKQFKGLSRNPHIVVGTPGRIIDHLDRKTIDVSHIHTLALDEADEMLKMGFAEDLERILTDMPKDRQTVLFSATIPKEIRNIAKKYQKNAEIISVLSKSLTVDSISQFYFDVYEEDKPKLLIRLLDLEKPQSAIVFANTKKEVDIIAENLQGFKYEADALHGDLKQSQRNYVMGRFRNKTLKLLIATDVAARGLDISDVEVIINYDLPQQDEVYVHRIGRTGRAGKKGKAYSFVTPRKRRMIPILEAFTKSTINRIAIPTPEDIAKKNKKRFFNDLKDLALKNDKTYDDVIEKFSDIGIDSYQLINGLIANLEPTTKAYDEIKMIELKPKKGEKGSKGATASKIVKGNYITLSINLGRKDGINPAALLDFLNKEYKLYSKNVGDIKHKDLSTTFEVKADALAKISGRKTVKYKGRTINLSIVKSK